MSTHTPMHHQHIYRGGAHTTTQPQASFTGNVQLQRVRCHSGNTWPNVPYDPLRPSIPQAAANIAQTLQSTAASHLAQAVTQASPRTHTPPHRLGSGPLPSNPSRTVTVPSSSQAPLTWNPPPQTFSYTLRVSNLPSSSAHSPQLSSSLVFAPPPSLSPLP